MRTIAWISVGAITIATVLYSAGCRPPTMASDLTTPDVPSNPVDPTPPESKDFTAFVKSLLNQTSDTTEPVSIDNIQFTFTEDPTAFDDVLRRDSTTP